MSSGQGTIMIDGENREKVKGLFDLLDEIQQYAASEEMITIADSKSQIHKFFTFNMRLEYFIVGFKAIMGSFIITSILMPLFFSAISGAIPIFGSYEAGIVDSIYLVLLTFGLTFGYLAFFLWICSHNKGLMTEAMIFNVVSGVSIGALVKGVMGFFAFNIMYHYLVTPDKLTTFFSYFTKVFEVDVVTRMLKVALEIRESFLSTGAMMLLVGLIYIVVIWAGYFYYHFVRKSKEVKEF